MNSNASENRSDGEILDFLKRAHGVGWPQGVTPTTKRELPGFSDVLFAEGEWSYHDLFGGATADIGFEVIFFSGEPVWGIAYRGGVTGLDPVADDVFAFLVEAMRAPNDMSLPLRGPGEYIRNDWCYRYRVHGGVSSFLGVERIYYRGVLCYERLQVGGRFGDHALYGTPIDLSYCSLDHLPIDCQSKGAS